MTSTQLAEYKKLMGYPFAGAPSAEPFLYDIRKDGTYSSTSPSAHKVSDLSIEKGFGPSYDVPVINGGSPLDTTILNSTINLTTRDAAYRQAGGIYTFEQEISDIIGGYPEGAILQYIDSNGTLHFLRSMVDNNTSNFVTGGIDTTKWQFCLPAESASNVPTVDWGGTSAVRVSLASIQYGSITEALTNRWYPIASGSFGSLSGYINTYMSSGTVTIGPADAQIPAGTTFWHYFNFSIGGNSGITIGDYSPEEILSGIVDGSTFQVATLVKTKTGQLTTSWAWLSNTIIPVNAGTTWSLKYKCLRSDGEQSAFYNSDVIIDGSIKIVQQLLR